MKLYRRHTKEFQELIDKSESFVADTTRRYNRLRDKNAAELYFYATTEAGAEFYRQYDDFGNEIPTDLHVYEADPLLLDLRKAENRERCTSVLEVIYSSQVETLKKMIGDYRSSFEHSKSAKERKLYKGLFEAAENKLLSYSIADVVKDNPVSGTTLWGQIASDYEAGVALKADLLRLGYDGFIYEDGCIEVGLLSPARKIR
jgi:hypothetical protein